MIEILVDMFNSPEAYLNDWYGWATNQAGHVFIVGFGLYIASALVAKLVIYLIPGFEDDPHAWAVIAVPLLYLFWEAAQLMLGSTLKDSAVDWAFVSLGGVLAYAIWKGMRRMSLVTVLITLAAIIWGALRRR